MMKKEYNLWDFSVDVQEYLKKFFIETGYDKEINMETTFIEGEESEYIDFQDFLCDLDFEDTDFEENLSELTSSNKMEFSEGRVKFSDKIEYIHLSKLAKPDDSINFFSPPDNEDFLNLLENVEMYGIINPLLVILDKESGNYTVISGNSRLTALNVLYNESKDQRFLYAPCIVLDSNTDDSIIQSIVITTNLSYRKISKEEQIKAVLLLDDALIKGKKYKNQMNITDVIAAKAGISRTTANTLRGFKHLSPKALDLLYKGNITRNAARILSMENHNIQNFIIDGLGNQINDISKLKEIIAEPGKLIYDKELIKADPVVPVTTKVTIYIDNNEVEDLLKALLPLRAEAAIRHQACTDNEINKYFKVVFNRDHMNQYLQAGRVTRETLDNIKSGEYKEVVKFA